MQKNNRSPKRPTKRTIFGGLEFSIDTWQVVILAFLIVAIVYTNFYYQYYFGFSIFSYLDLSEIPLIAFVNLGALGSAVNFLFDYSSKFIPVSVIAFIVLFTIAFFAKPIKFPKRTGFFIILFTFNLNIIVQSLDRWILHSDDIWAFLIFITMFLGAVTYYGWQTERAKFNPDHFVKIFPSLLAFTIILFIVCSIVDSGIQRHKTIVDKHFTYGTKIILDSNKSITSDSQFYFIDKSKNYVFMWSEKDTAITAIPMTEVKKLIVHNGYPEKSLREILPKNPIMFDSLPHKDILNLSLKDIPDTLKKLQK